MISGAAWFRPWCLRLDVFCFMGNFLLLSPRQRITRRWNLKQAILRSAVHCYAVEGIYPASLSYLEKHYGISWNPEEYAVDYEVFSSNLPPTVTVIDLRS